jgi:release factor glutamine methyltransferase
LKNYSGERFLEIGFGAGSNLKDVEERFSLVLGTDIKVESKTVQKSAEIFKARYASCFRDNTFDVVAFNPPYLPSEKIVDVAVDGGENGIEVAKEFLKDARRVLKKDGKILVLLSSESSTDLFRRYSLDNGLSIRQVGVSSMFFEKLFVFELTVKA